MYVSSLDDINYNVHFSRFLNQEAIIIYVWKICKNDIGLNSWFSWHIIHLWLPNSESCRLKGQKLEIWRKKNLSSIIQEINPRLMTLRMITQRDEREIKRNLRHFPVISSEWQITGASQLSLFGTWRSSLSHKKEKKKKDPLNQKTK